MEYVPVEISSGSRKELVVGDKVFRSAFDFHLSEEELEICRKELKETEEGRKDALQELKEMLRSDQDFKYREDEAYLLRYLRYRKFNVKESYRSLRNLYVTRQKYPDLFHINPNLEFMLSNKILTLMPYTDEQGSMIFLFRFGQWNPDVVPLRDLIHMVHFQADIYSLNPHIQINGLVGIWDFAEPTFKKVSHAVKNCNPSLFLKMIQEIYPWRIKRVILLNHNAFLHSAFHTIRWLLKPKIAERIVLLRSDLDELHQFVNPVLLPKEYGGTLEDKECYAYLNDILLGNLPYLQYEHSFSRKHNNCT